MCMYVYIYLYTHTQWNITEPQKNEILPFAATQQDLEIILLSEVRERKISCDITYKWDLKKKVQMNFLQNRNRLIDIENKLVVTKGERWGDKLRVWD